MSDRTSPSRSPLPPPTSSDVNCSRRALVSITIGSRSTSGASTEGAFRPTVELTGTNSGCSFLYKSVLAEGYRFTIASERLRPDAHETDLGNVLAWKHTGTRWTFNEDALAEGSDETYYPSAARAATTTAEIVQLVLAAPMPDTGTASPG